MFRIGPIAALHTMLAPVVCATVLAAPASARPSVTGCHPAPEHPHPVVLVHGTTATAASWNRAIPELLSRGYCVYAPTYGVDPLASLSMLRPGTGGVGPAGTSLAELAEFISLVRTATDEPTVDLVGVSQGAGLIEYYTKFIEPKAVHAAILLAPPTYGSTLDGLYTVANVLSGGSAGSSGRPVNAAVHVVCRPCSAMTPSGWLVRRLTDGPVAVPGVRYSVLATRNDLLVTPPGKASFIREPGVINQWVQDLCGESYVAIHPGLEMNPVVIEWALRQLDPRESTPYPCTAPTNPLDTLDSGSG